MKFTLSGLFLIAVALSSAAVSNAYVFDSDDSNYATNSTGCQDLTCWASCSPLDSEGNIVNIPDPYTSYEEGGDWCWIKRKNGSPPPDYDWAECEEFCEKLNGDVFCDPDNKNACGPS